LTILRASTLREIDRLLDASYFTRDAFSVEHRANEEPFLVITFLPVPGSHFIVAQQFTTAEAPGYHSYDELTEYVESWSDVVNRLKAWVVRIREDLKAGSIEDRHVDQFIAELRNRIFETDAVGSEFTSEEIDTLRSQLDELRDTVLAQAERLSAVEEETARFAEAIDDAKRDLTTMPKSLWQKISGTKVLASMRWFLKTPEGRTLIADAIKRVLPGGES
jgi:hypothetical protein